MSAEQGRDNFSSSVRRALAERVAYLCSEPSCRRVTVGPHSDVHKVLRVGRASHIHAAAPGGPRYDEAQTPEERAAITNGIWLCTLHADVVDKDEVPYPAALLRKWKNDAEVEVLRRLKHGLRSLAIEDQVPTRRDRVDAAGRLDLAFDLLAGANHSTRLTWQDVPAQQTEQARRLISEAATLDPQSARRGLLQAIYLHVRGFPDSALTELAAVPVEERTADHDLLQAQCLYFIGLKTEALSLLTRLAASNAAPASVFYNLGYLHLQAGDVEKAEAEFLDAVQRDPDYFQAWDMLGGIAYSSNDLRTAYIFAARAYSIAPSDVNATCNLATVLLDTDQVENALAVLDVLNPRGSTDSRVRAVYGRALAQAGNLAEAERYLRRAALMAPEDPNVHLNLGNVLAQLGNLPGAAAAWETALAVGLPPKEGLTKMIEQVRATLAATPT